MFALLVGIDILLNIPKLSFEENACITYLHT